MCVPVPVLLLPYTTAAVLEAHARFLALRLSLGAPTRATDRQTLAAGRLAVLVAVKNDDVVGDRDRVSEDSALSVRRPVLFLFV